jgi:hypothetical protein
MDIWNTDKLVLFVAFVVPGFVSLKTYQLLFQTVPKDSSSQIVDAVAYSCLNYALLSWPILGIEESGIRKSSPNVYYAFYFFVLFVMPVALVCALMKLRNTGFFLRTLPHPTGKPWDYVFAQRKPYWVVVTLKSAKKIAGRYDSASFSSSSPMPEQIYLQEAWELNADGGFERVREETAGIIILASDIESVELFNLKYGGSNDRQAGAAAGRVPTAEERPTVASEAAAYARRENKGGISTSGAGETNSNTSP